MRAREHSRRLLAFTIAVATWLFLMDGSKAEAKEKRVNYLLHSIHDEYQLLQEGPPPVVDGLHSNLMGMVVWKEEGLILVEVTASDEGAETLLQSAFSTYDFEKLGCSKYSCSGYLPIEKFPEFETQEGVRGAYPSISISNQAGSVVSEAFQSLQVDRVRLSDPTLTGAGLRIGILSDSFDALGGYLDDQATGDLPPGVTVLRDFSRGTDEGRGMAQLVHDLIPDAEIFFHTAFGSAPVFVRGIQALADASCNVIVDDVIDLREPFFQDGRIAQKANDVAELQGIPYFSSAGNEGKNSWEGIFFGSGLRDANSCELHDFGGGITRQRVEVEPGLTDFVFQWEDPFFTVSGPPGASRDMDFRLFFPSGSNTIIAEGIESNIGGDAVELLFVENLGTSTLVADLEFSLCTTGTPPPRMKWIGFGVGGILDFDTKSATLFGHPNMPFTAGVGAAFFQDTPAFGTNPPVLELFSSRGGTPILFERDGTRKSSDEVRKQPRFVATDGCVNTFFGDFTSLSPNGPGYYFFGTSAAAPNAAAVAILLLQVNPSLTPLEIYSILEMTAIDMGPDGFDFDSGFGYIDAEAAVVTIMPPPTMEPNPEPSPPPTAPPSTSPTSPPTFVPTMPPSVVTPLPTPPTAPPSSSPTPPPTFVPTTPPSVTTLPPTPPTAPPSTSPTLPPTFVPTTGPSVVAQPTTSPTAPPSTSPTRPPTFVSTTPPSVATLPPTPPTAPPSTSPTPPPTFVPTTGPSVVTQPTTSPTAPPSISPTPAPTVVPTMPPSVAPTPSTAPTSTSPTFVPTNGPSVVTPPTTFPTVPPSTSPTPPPTFILTMPPSVVTPPTKPPTTAPPSASTTPPPMFVPTMSPPAATRPPKPGTSWKTYTLRAKGKGKRGRKSKKRHKVKRKGKKRKGKGKKGKRHSKRYRERDHTMWHKERERRFFWGV